MRYFHLLLLLFIVTDVFADNIMIRQKNGNETILELATNPIITFADENMVVTNNFTSIILPLEDIDSYVVSNDNTGILKVTDAPEHHNGHVVFKGIVEETSVLVHSLDGNIRHKYTSDGSGILDVNIGIFPKGVYIITTSNYQIKVINK